MEQLLLLLLALAVALDIKHRRLPNRLCLAGMLLGLAAQTWAGGSDGLVAAMEGIGAGFLTLLPFYLFLSMGAGDVKFMAAVGAWLGPGSVVHAAIFSMLAGGMIALVLILVRELPLILQLSSAGRVVPEPALRPRKIRFPFAIGIAIGTLATLWQESGASALAYTAQLFGD